MIESLKSNQHIPLSIEFPSFAPSLNASPKIQKSGQSSTFQSLNSPQVHKISIHLPQELFQDQEESLWSKQTALTSKSQNITQQQKIDSGKIRVFCRMRKPYKSEDAIKYDSTMVDDGQNCYSFDYIFHKNAVQKQLYERIAKRHIDDFFMCKNSTIFAYGQTGSGKTHTMFGKFNQPTQYGIIPRALQQIFKRNSTDIPITCSMVEIYNEKLIDLFGGLVSSQTEIKLKEINDKIYLQGLQQITVQNKEEMLGLIQEGHKNRKISSTLSNDASSRSHTILFVVRKIQCMGQQITSKLCFIDLAGSEKVKKSGAKGQTLQQTKKINLSLSCLGNVVHSLTNGSEHIPYRNSKLTRILKDSLAADTTTSIITTCSLQKSDLNETLSTIKFAVRAKKIKNKKKLENEQVSLEQKFIILKKQLELTKKELAHYKEMERNSKIFNSMGKGDTSSFQVLEQSVIPNNRSLQVIDLKQKMKDSDQLSEVEAYQIAEQLRQFDPPRIFTKTKCVTSRIRSQSSMDTLE